MINLQNHPFFCALKERIPVLPWNIDRVFLRKRALENILERLLRGKQKPELPDEYQEGPLGFSQKAVTDKNKSPACRQHVVYTLFTGQTSKEGTYHSDL
ncbi:hypothetical protein [Eubacterium callanderi]|uniref:hypothetical protein n=1 Tax=Eubacterium callanderi TaxID=53442 RepID=UPI001AA0FF6D|nr:hypothetical protein [Eubacterium callanderi]